MPKPIEKSFQRSELRTAESNPVHEEIEVRAYEIYVERGGSWTRTGGIGCNQNGAHSSKEKERISRSFDTTVRLLAFIPSDFEPVE